MALATFADLKTSVATWLNRSDLTSVIPDFVALAEADIRRDVRIQAMEQLATGTLTGETLAHPTRYLEARRLTVDGYVYDYVQPSLYQDASRNSSQALVFTSIGTNLYILNGASGQTYSLIYYASYVALSGASDTNDLLTNYPDVYLWASLKHGATYLVDDQAIAKYAGMYQAAVAKLNQREQASRYSGGRLEMRAR